MNEIMETENFPWKSCIRWNKGDLMRKCIRKTTTTTAISKVTTPYQQKNTPPPTRLCNRRQAYLSWVIVSR